MGKWPKYPKKHNKDWEREPSFKGKLSNKNYGVFVLSRVAF